MTTQHSRQHRTFLSWLGWILVHPDQHRLRMAWRLALFFALLYASQRALVTLDGILGLSTPNVIRSLVSVFAAVFVACPLLDRRRYGDLGFRINARWWMDLGFGAFVGALLTGIIFVIMWAVGWVHIEGLWRSGDVSSAIPQSLSGWLGFIIAAGVSEELLVRGYLLTNLAEGLGKWRISKRWAVLSAWILSSCFFGLLHINNPSANWSSTLNIILAGLFLGLPYVLTGSLALPIGLHVSWNLFLGPVFGLPVSGLDMRGASILRVSTHGPVAWTGGAFGPEAGLLGTLAFAMGSICILLWSQGMDDPFGLLFSLAEPPPVPVFDPSSDS